MVNTVFKRLLEMKRRWNSLSCQASSNRLHTVALLEDGDKMLRLLPLLHTDLSWA